MRIVGYNILDGGEGRADPLAEVILAQRPDIVALVEADNLAVLERIASRLKMDFIHGAGRGHACALLSRWTIRQSINHAALRRDVAGAMLEATIAAPGADISVCAAQLNSELSQAPKADVFIGEFAGDLLVKFGFIDVLPASAGGTFSTQDASQRRDQIFTRGIDASRVKGAWVERDRLAKYASDHFPVGVEIV